MASTIEYEVLVHDEDGSLWAEIPDLPGLFVSGDSDAELAEALAEAIPMYLTRELDALADTQCVT